MASFVHHIINYTYVNYFIYVKTNSYFTQFSIIDANSFAYIKKYSPPIMTLHMISLFLSILSQYNKLCSDTKII